MSGSIKVAGHEHIRHDIANDKLVYGNGVPAGSVLQVQYSELLYPVGTTNTTDTESGLQCSITPTAATNYIFAEFHVETNNAAASYAVRLNLKVEGGGTVGNIGAGTGGPGGLNNRTNAFKCIAGGPSTSGNYATDRFSAKVRFRCNDTIPNWSSGELTVKLMFSTNNSSYQARINFAEGADTALYSATASQLILTEVKG